MRNKINLVIMVLLVVPKMLLSQPMTIPHAIYIGFLNESGEAIQENDLYWEAWRMNLPSDVLTKETSKSSKYFVVDNRQESYIQVQTADFKNPLEDDDVVSLYLLELSTGASATAEVKTSLVDSFEMYPDIVTLTTYQKPPAPILSAIKGNADIVNNKIILEWSPVERCSEYMISIGLKKEFLKELARIKDNSYTIDQTFEPDTEYFWSVTPLNEWGQAVVLKVFSFRTK